MAEIVARANPQSDSQRIFTRRETDSGEPRLKAYVPWLDVELTTQRDD
jgi:hypothetical protein